MPKHLGVDTFVNPASGNSFSLSTLVITSSNILVSGGTAPVTVGPVTGPLLSFDQRSIQAAGTGTTTAPLYLNPAGNNVIAPSLSLTATPLAISSGGTGASAAVFTQGANILISGTFPNYTIACSNNPVFLNVQGSYFTTTTAPAVALTSGNYGMQVTSGTNSLIFDYQSIQSRASGGTSAAPLFLNPLGGTVGAPSLVLSAPLAVSSGGTGVTGASLVQGSNISITGTWPNQTVSATGFVTGVTANSPLSVSGSSNAPVISIPSPLPITNGGTGATSQNFVDLSTSQTIAGSKTFTGSMSLIAPVNVSTAGGVVNLISNAASGASIQIGAGDSSFHPGTLFVYDNRSSTVLSTFSQSTGNFYCLGNITAAGITSLTTPLSAGNGGTGCTWGIGLASMTANVAPASTTELQIVGGTIPANTLNAGSTFALRARGQCTVTTAGATITIRCRIGTASLSGNVACSIIDTTVVGTAITFAIDMLVTVRSIGASGTIIGIAQQTNTTTGISGNANVFGPPAGTAPAAVAVNTTVSNILEMTVQTTATTSIPTFYLAEISVEKL